MHGSEFLFIAQTTKCRVVEDNEVLYVHALETHSSCWHSTNVLLIPSAKKTTNLVLVFILVFISTSLRQLGFTSDLQENNASTITTTDGSWNSRLGWLPYHSVEYRLF